MKNRLIKASAFSFLILFLVNCSTFQIGQFDYIEVAAKDAPPASTNLINKTCGTYNDPLLSKAFEEGKSEAIKNAKIVYQLEESMACYSLYGEKGEFKKEPGSDKKAKGAKK